MSNFVFVVGVLLLAGSVTSVRVPRQTTGGGSGGNDGGNGKGPTVDEGLSVLVNAVDEGLAPRSVPDEGPDPPAAVEEGVDLSTNEVEGGAGFPRTAADEGEAVPRTAEEEALNLPSNAAGIRANIVDTFDCTGKEYGYYADPDNGCQIFHVCLTTALPTGQEQVFKWSFICPEATVFDQSLLTCQSAALAIDCAEAASFYSVNDNFGDIPEGEGPREDTLEVVPDATVDVASDDVTLDAVTDAAADVALDVVPDDVVVVES